MPRIFIGIPTRNRPDLLRHTVASVLAQSVSDFTVVVSDNDSCEETVESVTRYLESLHDSRVSFHRQPCNVGEYGQGRFLFHRATGHDFFMLLHDDDVLNPGYLARAL